MSYVGARPNGVNLPQALQELGIAGGRNLAAWTRTDMRSRTRRTTMKGRPVWSDVVARVTADAVNGDILDSELARDITRSLPVSLPHPLHPFARISLVGDPIPPTQHVCGVMKRVALFSFHPPVLVLWQDTLFPLHSFSSSARILYLHVSELPLVAHPGDPGVGPYFLSRTSRDVHSIQRI